MGTRIWAAVAAVAVAGCAEAFGQTDGFPVKLEAGCATVDACLALMAEAQERVDHCRPNTIGAIRCQDARADLSAAQELLARARATDTSPPPTRWHPPEPEARPVWDSTAGDAARAQAQAIEAELDARCAKEREEEAERRRREEETARAAREAARVAKMKARTDAEAWIAKRCRVVKTPVYDTKVYVDAGGFVKAGRVIVDYDEKTVCPGKTPPEVIAAGCLEEDGASWSREDACDDTPTVSPVPAGQAARDVLRLSPECAGLQARRRPTGPRTLDTTR